MFTWNVMAPDYAPELFQTLEGWNRLEVFEDKGAKGYYRQENALEKHKRQI